MDQKRQKAERRREGAARDAPGSWNRVHARLAAYGRAPRALAGAPEPPFIGAAERADALADGVLAFGDASLEAPGAVIWDLEPPSTGWRREAHGFGWLDDMAAAARPRTRETLRAWVFDWINRHGAGSGEGWRAEIAGRRLSRWICHSGALLTGATAEREQLFRKALGAQARFVARRWRAAPTGLGRMEAAAGLVCAGLTLEGEAELLSLGLAAAGETCATALDGTGGLASRNPEDLAEMFALTVWLRRAAERGGHAPVTALDAPIAAMAAALRALRFGDGTLARFHGGGEGRPGRLDRALAQSGARAGARAAAPMGFRRLSAGQTTIVIDASAPPMKGALGCASALALEFHSGRRAIVTSCGPGAGFGETWRLACRATAAHSALTLAGFSSARLGRDGAGFVGAPATVSVEREEDAKGVWLRAGHDGYRAAFGLTASRRLNLSTSGRDFRGEDTLHAASAADRRRFDAAAASKGVGGALPYAVRFHLHPAISLERESAGVRLTTASGEVWRFTQGGGDLMIADSLYLDSAVRTPRATKQIVVMGDAASYGGRVQWAFQRIEADDRATRDLAPFG